MQTVTAGFTTKSQAAVRIPQATLNISWTKAYNTSGLFTINTSAINGTDAIPGTGYVPNEFSLFTFEDDTSYIQSLTIDRFLDQPTSIAKAAADIILTNTSHRFTSGVGSPIDGLVIVGRPVQIQIGFNNEYVNLFNGIISDYPTLNKMSSNVELFCFDPIDIISAQLITAAITLTNVTVDQVLVQLMAQLGIAATNYSFGTGIFNIISFSCAIGDSVGQILHDLMEVEGGYLWYDETGKFRFTARNTNPYTATGIDLADSMVISVEDLITNYIINTCQVNGTDLMGNAIHSTYIDTSSVNKYGTQPSPPFVINSPYIQSQAQADTLAALYVASNADLEAFHVVTIVGLPQLQVGDLVTKDFKAYVVVRITTKYNADTGLTQALTIRRYTLGGYFTINTSAIQSTTQIAP